MKYIALMYLIGITSCAFATDERGKIKICRDPDVVTLTDKYPVVLAPPFYFKQFVKGDPDGDAAFMIEVDTEISLGKKPSCVIAEGFVTRNAENKAVPKKGSVWRAEAEAKPGQFWGKQPVEKLYPNGGSITEYDPTKGGQIEGATLRGHVLVDFK